MYKFGVREAAPMAELKITDAGRLSHAYLISAPDPGEALKTARGLASAASAPGPGRSPAAAAVPAGRWMRVYTRMW